MIRESEPVIEDRRIMRLDRRTDWGTCKWKPHWRSSVNAAIADLTNATDCSMSFVSLIVAISFGAPPHLMDARNVLQRFDDAGIQTQGRDPFAGTGLCGALLPVRVPNDVYHVSLPARGFNSDHLRLLRRFPNLRQVRCRCTVTEADHRLIESNVPTGAWLLYDVRLDDGTVDRRRPVRSGYRLADEDINGDGIVDENDEVLAEVTKGG